MFVRLLLPLLLASAARPCAGQPGPVGPADSVARRTVQLPAARVERIRRRSSPSGSYVTHLDPARLGPGASLGAVLALSTPLVVRQYGPGQLASLSVRGTGPQHVATLWNGFNISFATVGQVDLSLLPAAALTAASLTHGPDAARYGAGAVGGALVLRTDGEADTDTDGKTDGEADTNANTDADLNDDHDARPTPHLRAQAAIGAGAFGQRALSARVSGAAGRHTVSTSGQVGWAANDFSYRFRTFRGAQTARQVNAQTRSYSVTHDHTVALGEAWRLAAAAWLTGADRQIAPALNTPNTHAREHDASQRFSISLMHRQRTTLRVASLTDVINYADDPNGASDSRAQSWQAQLESTCPLPRLGLTLRGGLEAQRFGATADGYGAGRRTEHRAAAFGELTWAGAGLADGPNRLTATFAVRRAVLPGQVVPLTPALTADWLALPAAGLHLWASAARAYRPPTLNERYWSPGGNPDLLPETSAGYQVGASIGPQRSAANAPWPAFFRAEIVAFDQRIREWVQWTPDAGTGLWSPRNLRRVRSRGAEGTLEVALPGRQTTLRLAGQLLETRKTAGLATDPAPAGIQLPYVPARTGSATLAYARPLGRRLTLGADANATVSSQRTTNAAGTETLPAYGLLHAGLRGAWHRPATATVSLRLDAFNLLDTDYQSQTNRPMPGRAWQLTLAVQTP